jgi:predicted nucleotidyltransferase
MGTTLAILNSDMPALDELEVRTGATWNNIRTARNRSVTERILLEETLGEFTSTDASLVVVGSLARHEFTPGSDIDWTLLLDGIAFAEHLKVAHAIRKRLDDLEKKQPGREGIFGTIASSHDLVHRIGGQDDTNANTTLRILLLLESEPIGRSDAYGRVMKNILFRYLNEDRGLWHGSGPYKVPRFLFNDVARYWRTMTVDFAYKQRNRQNEGFAIRNLKLRMSRKLLFLAGMVACFECHNSFSDARQRKNFYEQCQVQPLIDLLMGVLAKPPLEIVAFALARDSSLDEQSKRLFDSYDEFLGMLADETLSCDGKTIRDHLDQLPSENLGSDDVASRGREISHRFRDAIASIFLNAETELSRMTIEFGVF